MWSRGFSVSLAADSAFYIFSSGKGFTNAASPISHGVKPEYTSLQVQSGGSCHWCRFTSLASPSPVPQLLLLPSGFSVFGHMMLCPLLCLMNLMPPFCFSSCPNMLMPFSLPLPPLSLHFPFPSLSQGAQGWLNI